MLLSLLVLLCRAVFPFSSPSGRCCSSRSQLVGGGAAFPLCFRCGRCCFGDADVVLPFLLSLLGIACSLVPLLCGWCSFALLLLLDCFFLWRCHVDHDISCETQLLEVVSLNSVVHLVSAVFVSILLSARVLFLLTPVYLHRHVHLRPTVILRECDDPPIFNGSRKSPVQSHVRTWQRSLLLRHGTRESPWVLWNVAGIWMEELAQRLQQLETQVGQQFAVIEHQQDQLMRQQTTIDAERAARTSVTPTALDASGNLVDLRVGYKPETFVGETHEWKGWSFKMRQCIAAVDEELFLELVNVEANPLREGAFGRDERASEDMGETACVHG